MKGCPNVRAPVGSAEAFGGLPKLGPAWALLQHACWSLEGSPINFLLAHLHLSVGLPDT